MSSPSEELLIQRQLRAAEIALETARRRRFETDEAVRALQAEVADVEAALSVALLAREQDRAQADARVAAARRAQLEAEQRLIGERNRRLTLEQQLNALTRELADRDVMARQLAAEQRIQSLEGELELVLRRAAEFEYGVRMAAFDALKLVRGLADRVAAVLPGVGSPDDPAAVPPSASPGTPRGGEAPGAGAEETLETRRLDAALERLRAAAPELDDEA